MANDITQAITAPAPIAPDPTSATNPTPAPNASGNKKNPLDVLEQLLNEIDAGSGGNSASSSGKDAGGGQSTKLTDKLGANPQTEKPQEPAGPTPEEIAAQEQEQNRIEFEKKQAEQQIIDDQLIAQQRQALETEMSNGTINVARAEQDEEKKTEVKEKKQAQEGFEVVQLDHTKI